MWTETAERRSTSSTPTTPSQVRRKNTYRSRNLNNRLQNQTKLFKGRATYADKLFKFRNGRFEDLLGDDINVRRGVANRMAGRSVACVDRKVIKLSIF